MGARALEAMARVWDMDPARHFVSGVLGTGISAAWWHSPDTAQRTLKGCGEDVWILAYHGSGLDRARMVMDGARVYDGTVGAGTWLLVPPGGDPRAEVSGVWDVLHLYIPHRFVERLASEQGLPSLTPLAQRCTRLVREARIAPLLGALAQAESVPLAESQVPLSLRGSCRISGRLQSAHRCASGWHPGS